MVADPDGAVVRAWGVGWPLIGLARRVTFVVGRDRKVREVVRGERDADKHVAEACAFVAKPPSP